MNNLVRKKNLRKLVLTREAMKHLNGMKKLVNKANSAIKAIIIAEMTTVPHKNAPTRPNVFYKMTKTGRILKIRK